MFYQNSLAMRNTAKVKVAFYDIHREKREVLLFYFVPDTTRDLKNINTNIINVNGA
jgi:hypothetical protein